MPFSPLKLFFIASLFSASAAFSQSGGPELTMPPDLDLAKLLDKPRKFQVLYQAKGPEGGGLFAATDYHALYEVPAQDFFAALCDFAVIKKINPSNYEVSHDLKNWPPEFIQDQLSGFSVIGIKVRYRLKVRCRYEEVGPGEYRGHWKLIENPDGVFSDVEGSFLLKEINYQGHRCSYIRWYQSLSMYKSFFGIKPFLEILSAREMQAHLNGFARVAKLKQAERVKISRP